VLCSPLLPGITDDAASLNAVAARAKSAGASFFSAQPLFLKSCSKETFFDFVREHFPTLETAYAARYSRDAFVSQAYSARIAELVASVSRKHGLRNRTTDAILTREHPAEPTPQQAQQSLWA
jgi:DNA repair photolyase